MASSEIEVVSSAEAKPNENQNDNQTAVTDVFSASAYGDFEKLRKFVEEDGASVSRPDGNGYFALQWAALNNFADIVQYIIDVKQFSSIALIVQLLCVWHFSYISNAAIFFLYLSNMNTIYQQIT